MGIRNNIWVKNWSSNWGVAFASLYWLYTINLKPYGNDLKTNLVVCEKEVSSNYIAKKELDNYCNDIAKKIISDDSFGEKLVAETISTARSLHDIFNKFKIIENLNLSNLLELKNRFYTHIPPHFAIKKVIDYLPEELRIKLLPAFTKARVATETLDLFNTTDNILRSYTKLVSKRAGYSSLLTKYLTLEEIILFLKNNSLPTEKELAERFEGLAIFYNGNHATLLTGSSYTELIKFLIGCNKNELMGNIAYKGIARGIVRIIFDSLNVKEFNKGDVLVTGMTRPEFLPLMKKASAVVTDAGGLLSHVAIVARELKKPCILSTEIATRVLSDGDLVEVNANIGVVKIIKKCS